MKSTRKPAAPTTVRVACYARKSVAEGSDGFGSLEAQRTFIVAEPGSGEDYRILDLLLVTSIDFVDEKRHRRNGAKR